MAKSSKEPPTVKVHAKRYMVLPPMPSRLFVGGVPDEGMLHLVATRIASAAGARLESVTPAYNPAFDNEFRGFGHVQLADTSEEQVQGAVKLLHRSRWKGLYLRVQPARADHITRLTARMKPKPPVPTPRRRSFRDDPRIPKHYIRVRPQPRCKVLRVAPPARVIGNETLADPAFGSEDVKAAIAEQAKEAADCIGKSRSKRRQRMHPVHLIFSKRAMIHHEESADEETDHTDSQSDDGDSETDQSDDGESETEQDDSESDNGDGETDQSDGSASEEGDGTPSPEPARSPSPQLLLHTGYLAGHVPEEWGAMPQDSADRIWERAAEGSTARLSRGRRRGLARALVSKLPKPQAAPVTVPAQQARESSAGAGGGDSGWLGLIRWDGTSRQGEGASEAPAPARTLRHETSQWSRKQRSHYADEGTDDEDALLESKPGRSDSESSDSDDSGRRKRKPKASNKGQDKTRRRDQQAGQRNRERTTDDDRDDDESDADSLGEFAVQQRKAAAQRLRDVAAGEAEEAADGSQKLDMFADEDGGPAMEPAQQDASRQATSFEPQDSRLDALRARTQHDDRFRFDSRFLESDEEGRQTANGGPRRKARVPGPEGMTRGQHKLLEDDEFEAMVEDDEDGDGGQDSQVADAYADAPPEAPTGAQLDAEADRSLGLLDGVLGVIGLSVPGADSAGAGGGEEGKADGSQLLSLASSVSRGPANAAEDEVAARRMVDRAAEQIDASDATQPDEAIVPDLRSLRGSATIVAKIALRTRQQHASRSREDAMKPWSEPSARETDPDAPAPAVAADEAVDDVLAQADAVRGFIPGGMFRFDPTKQACRVLLRNGGVKQAPKRLAADAAVVEKLQRVAEHQKPAEPASGPRQVVIQSTWRKFYGMEEADQKQDAAEPDARGLVNRDEWRQSGKILKQAKAFTLFGGEQTTSTAFEAAPTPSAFEAAPTPSAFEAAPTPSAFALSGAPATVEASPFSDASQAAVGPSPFGGPASAPSSSSSASASASSASAFVAPGAFGFGSVPAAPQTGSKDRLERVAAFATRGQAFGGGDVDWDSKGAAEEADSDHEDARENRRRAPRRGQAGGRAGTGQSGTGSKRGNAHKFGEEAAAAAAQPMSALDALSGLLSGQNGTSLLAAGGFGSGKPMHAHGGPASAQERVDEHSGYAAYGHDGARKSQRRHAFKSMGRRARAFGKR